MLVDPAFQRELVAEARSRGIPVIFDEVLSNGVRRASRQLLIAWLHMSICSL